MSDKNMFSLKGRIALVTGAGQGVGRAIAHALAEQGARAIVVNDFYQERADIVAAELLSTGSQALAIGADVVDKASVDRMFEKVRVEYGELHILVNNAGNAGPGVIPQNLPMFSQTSPADWQQWLGTNLLGVMNCCHAAIPLLTAHELGRVVTIVSDAGRVGEVGYAAYSGAKAGASGFMRALAKEVGRYKTTANCVSLASIETPALAARNADLEYVKKKLARYVIRRQGQPEDVAGAVAFLASNAASWITGQTLGVNGGYSLGL